MVKAKSLLFSVWGAYVNDTLEEPKQPQPQESDMEKLLRKVKVSHYKAGDTRGIKRTLLELMEAVEHKVHHFRRECWNITIELLADHLGLMENPWKYSLPHVKWAGPIGKPNYPGFKELKDYISKTGLIEEYVTAAKAKPWDYLGDIFTDEELAGRRNMLGQLLTPKQIIDFIVRAVGIDELEVHRPDNETLLWLSVETWNYELQQLATAINLRIEDQRIKRTFDILPVWEKYTKPKTLMDPCTGTGRFFLVPTIDFPKAPLVLFGVEIDLSLYRACLVNMAMFANHPYSIICANTLMLDPAKTNPSDKIWDLGNQWNPPDITSFYWKPPPIRSDAFSLKAFTQLKDGDKASIQEQNEGFNNVIGNPPYNQRRNYDERQS